MAPVAPTTNTFIWTSLLSFLARECSWTAMQGEATSLPTAAMASWRVDPAWGLVVLLTRAVGRWAEPFAGSRTRS